MEEEQFLTRSAREVTGLFTQTILPSPIVQWILPARLRSKHHNDVVFVGQRRVQIKQASPGGFLEDVTEKNDFDHPIVGAKVIDVNTQLPWETQLHTTGVDIQDDLEVLDRLPSQILVLSLEMKELQFLYCPISGEDKFVTHRRPLPVDVDLADRFGKHIAVDPKSRAVAVSASNHYFGLFLLKSPKEIQQQMTEGKLDPIKREHFYSCDGTIQFMEFLYPRTADDKRIILLIITSGAEGSFARIFQWDEDDTTLLRQRCTEFKLRKEDRLPTMIVPLTKESAFLVVTSISMAVYPSDSSHARPTRYPLIAPDAIFKETSLWTQWARPARNWLYSQKYDGIYLCREDGWIYYLEFGNEGALETQTSLGQLHCDVDSAFDVLDMGHEGGDFILAAGSMGDGGLFIQEARDKPQCVQRFLNWAPVTDAVIVPSKTHGKLQCDVSRDRLFVCSASASGGSALHELRYGFEAQVGITVPLDDMSSIRDLWTISYDASGAVYVLISDPMSTLLLYMNPSLEDGISALDEAETGLDTAQTLAAGCTPTGVLIQVTEKATHLFVPDDISLNACVPHPPASTVVAVAVDGPSSAVITAIRSNNELRLLLTRVVVDDANVRLETTQSVEINREPVCMSLQTLGQTTFAFMGDGDGTITVFHVEQETITFFLDAKISVDRADDISRAIDSLAMIRQTYHGVLRAHLLCGLRSGILVPFQIDFNARTLIGLNQMPPKHVGMTSLRLQSKGAFAMLICDNELWRVSINADGVPNECFLSRVWITDQSNPAYFPIGIHGFGLINSQGLETQFSLGPLFCFADRQLLICSLDREAKIVPRRIGVTGTTRKLVYSSHLDRLIMSYDMAEVEDPSRPGDITMRSWLAFVRPDTQAPVDSPDQSFIPLPHTSRGEKITCIMDWVFERGGHMYHLVAIGTGISGTMDLGLRGRLILVSATRDPNDPSEVRFVTKHVQDCLDGPVRAIAAYDNTLLIGAGKTIRPVAPKGATIKWASRGWKEIPSPAVAITVSKPFVYVTTARHGFIILEVLDDGHGLHFLTLLGHDSRPLDGLTHYVTPGESSLAFLSARGGSIRVGKLLSSTELHTDQVLTTPAPEDNSLFDSVLQFLPSSKIDHLPKSPRERGGAIYGVALNGAVYRFSILREDEVRLLLALQDICRRDETLYTSLSAREKRKRFSWADPRRDNCQVDGDILKRLAQRRVDYLEDRINALDQKRDSYPTYDSFMRNAALKVLGPSDNYVHQVVGWLRQLLHVEI
ncbi:uncharacterized protein N7482_008268 [Penicillium canariense]|uniref:RSE1/DDB1/CPSF1 first beta-propeller domain-containing protein n=1 Tax=Penicillium canariense TaxID=189055 RepID=A0A9W9LIF0_9EURO|nr:uncharacterized protein N7482_008268 [Penicillium canariense]KAJ5157168.1 hypothetical protein N7482_008268 [Penicillium canariense]